MAILEGSSGKEKVKSVVCISYYGHLGNTQFKWLREPRFLFLLQVDSIATGLFSILVKSLMFIQNTPTELKYCSAFQRINTWFYNLQAWLISPILNKWKVTILNHLTYMHPICHKRLNFTLYYFASTTFIKYFM